MKNDIKKTNDKLKNTLADSNEPMALYKFLCKKCLWNCVGTLIGAPHKCHGCGSKDYLYKSMIITAKGRKIENPIEKKFNPDTNKFRDKIALKGNIKLKESAEIIDKKISKLLSSIKTTETKFKEEKPMSETKTFQVKCTNDKCGFAYDTNDAPSGSHQHKACQVCNRPTSHKEKVPIKKTSRFDRD